MAVLVTTSTIGGAANTLLMKVELVLTPSRSEMQSIAAQFMETMLLQLLVAMTPSLLLVQPPVHTFMPTPVMTLFTLLGMSASEVYLNTGDDLSPNAGLIAGSIYGGEGKDSVYVVDERQHCLD